MEKTVIDKLYNEFKELLSFLEEGREMSFVNIIDGNLRKTLLMAAASHFEDRFKSIIENFAKEASDNNALLIEFVKNKAISRQYHTYFDWKSRNANKFFALFGKTFKSQMESQIENDDELDKAVKAFIEIGSERNRLVHDDFGAFPIEKTTKEIYELYQNASIFIDKFPLKLKEVLSTNNRIND